MKYFFGYIDTFDGSETLFIVKAETEAEAGRIVEAHPDNQELGTKGDDWDINWGGYPIDVESGYVTVPGSYYG